MSRPSADHVMAAMEDTWPPLSSRKVGPFRVRRGAGGGKRVSAATAEGPFSVRDIAQAEETMRDAGQPPLFLLRPDEHAFDRALAGRGYVVVDPVTLFARPAADGPALPVAELGSDALARLWDGGGIGPERRAVMARVARERAVLCLPDSRAPVAAAFVALGDEGAMMHALHVDPDLRRRGHGRALTEGALFWAALHRAPWLSLAVTDANAPAIALYTSLGFEPVGRYWYRSLGE